MLVVARLGCVETFRVVIYNGWVEKVPEIWESRCKSLSVFMF